MRGNTLFICIFTHNLYAVDNHSFRTIINCMKDTVVACSDTIAFLMGKFFALVISWIIGKKKNCVINLCSLLKRDISCIFFSFSSNNYFVVSRFSHFVLNSSYGVRFLVSNSAFKRSLASSSSSTSSKKLSYSSKVIKTAFLCLFFQQCIGV